MAVYYNEHDRFAAQWLRNLIDAGHIAPGDVDERSIVDVRPGDLAGYTQCHFFAGIGGWSHALRLAGWPDDRPVWTGSCPCQPFSAAGKQKGEADERHLWPEFRRLIAECAPAIVFGEQVASRLGREWLAGVRADLEALGYACGAADLCAAGVGAPHIRQRLWWVADSDGGNASAEGLQRSRQHGQQPQDGCDGRMEHAAGDGRRENVRTLDSPSRGGSEAGHAAGTGEAIGMADAQRWTAERHRHEMAGAARHDQGAEEERERVWSDSRDGGTNGRLGNTDDTRSQGRGERSLQCAAQLSAWASGVPLVCTDGRARRVEPGVFPLAHGVPGRVGRLRAYGNAIVPQVAAAFIRASLT